MAKLLWRSPVRTKTGLPNSSQKLIKSSRSQRNAVHASSLFVSEMFALPVPPTCEIEKFTDDTTKKNSASDSCIVFLTQAF